MLFLYMLFVGALASTTTTAITAPTPTITTTPLAALNPREISSSTTSGIYFVSTMHIVVGGPTPNTIEIAIETCVQTITPDQNGYVPPGTCNSLWDYYPSFVAAAIFAVIFGVLTLAHIGQAIAYKKVRQPNVSIPSSRPNRIVVILLGSNNGCRLGNGCIHLSHHQYSLPAKHGRLSGLSNLHSTCPPLYVSPATLCWAFTNLS
jgi:hypothetical protein